MDDSAMTTQTPREGVRHYSVGGKVFILGEYAILVGLPALIGTLSGRFKMTASPIVDRSGLVPLLQSGVHPDSPLGRLQSWAQKSGGSEIAFHFEDPLEGKGGFGASTAQFAMAYLAYFEQNLARSGQKLTPERVEAEWVSLWKLYRELTGVDGQGSRKLIPPSGADLVAQWLGGVIRLDLPGPDSGAGSYQVLDQASGQADGKKFDWSGLLVFSATFQPGRKVATHEHLETLGAIKSLGLKLKAPLMRGFEAVEILDYPQLGKAMADYAEILRNEGLELAAALADRQAICQCPGVLGVKGTGALQADGLLVLMEPESGPKVIDQVVAVAQARGLRLMDAGLGQSKGVTCLTIG